MLRLRAPDPTVPVNSGLLQTFPERCSEKAKFGVTAMLSFAVRCPRWVISEVDACIGEVCFAPIKGLRHSGACQVR